MASTKKPLKNKAPSPSAKPAPGKKPAAKSVAKPAAKPKPVAKGVAKPLAARPKPVAKGTKAATQKPTPAKPAAVAKKAPAKSARRAPAPAETPAKKTLAKPTGTARAAVKPAAKVAKPTPAERGQAAVHSVSAAAQRIEQRRLARKRSADRRPSAPVNGKDLPLVLPSRVRAKSPLTKRDLKALRDQLVELRERLLGDIQFLTTDNLHRMGRETGADLSGSSQHSADHGTDNFDREFALSLASSEQDIIYEVDEALQRIDHDEYGICEYTGQPIEKARLEVIPYTRFSVQAQTLLERGRAKYRPFGQTFKGW